VRRRGGAYCFVDLGPVLGCQGVVKVLEGGGPVGAGS
jgi:hypothetical protein